MAGAQGHPAWPERLHKRPALLEDPALLEEVGDQVVQSIRGGDQHRRGHGPAPTPSRLPAGADAQSAFKGPLGTSERRLA